MCLLPPACLADSNGSRPCNLTKPWDDRFFGARGQSVAGALADAGLTLNDGPLFAIELMPLVAASEVATCPLHERDRHLLG